MTDPLGRDIPTNVPRPSTTGTITDSSRRGPAAPRIPVHITGAGLTLAPINGRDVEDVLRGYLNTAEPQFRKLLVNTWNAQAEALKFNELERALQEGAISTRVIDRWNQEYSAFVNEISAPGGLLEQSVLAGQGYMSNEISRAIGRQFEATEVGRRTREFIDLQGTRLLTNVTDQQRRAVTALVRHFAVAEPVAPAELGRYLRPAIRLTERDAKAVIRFRENLRKANPTMSAARLAQQTERYSNWLWRRRAETVARTELAYAHNFGQFNTVRGAVTDGTITRPVYKQWVTARDERMCPFCAALDGEIVGVEETYPGATQQVPNTYAPPAHPRCRCSTVYSMVGPAQSAQPAQTPQPPAQPQTPREPARTPAIPYAPQALARGIRYTDEGSAAVDLKPVFGLPTNNVVNHMMRDMPGKTKSVKLVDFDKGKGKRGLQMSFQSMDDGGEVFHATRFFTYDRDSISARHALFEISQSRQAAGVGKQFLRNSVEFYEQVGIKRITLTANIDVGGYSWARYGFKPTVAEWKELDTFKNTLKSNLQSIAARVKIPDSEIKAIERAINSNRRDALWRIADNRTPVTDVSGKESTLGKQMLLGTHWMGELDLTNRRAMRRLKKYIGME